MGAMAAAGMLGADAAATAGAALTGADIAAGAAAAGIGADALTGGLADFAGGGTTIAADFASGGAGAFLPGAADTAAAFGAPTVAPEIASGFFGPATAGDIASGVNFGNLSGGASDVLSAGAGSGAASQLGGLSNIFGGAQEALGGGTPQLPVTVAPTIPVSAGGAGVAGGGASAPAGGAAAMAAPPGLPVASPDITQFPGTELTVDPAYGFAPPAAPTAPPTADVFAAETAPAPQVAQLSPGGILQPGINGTQPILAGDYASWSSPLGGVAGTGAQPFDPANLISTATPGTPVPPDQMLVPTGATPTATSGPTQVATSTVGPDTSLASTGDFNVLNATRGAVSATPTAATSPDALAYAPASPSGGFTGPTPSSSAIELRGFDFPDMPAFSPAGGAPATGAETAAAGEAAGSAGGVAGDTSTAAATAPSVVGGGAVNVPTVAGSQALDTALATGGNASALAGGNPAGSSSGGGIWPWMQKNPLGAGALALAGGGLAMDALKSGGLFGNPPGYDQINSLAGNAAGNAQQLQSYLYSGTLPPGMQAAANQATASAEATIKSRYASMGMSGSSAETQDIQNMRQRMAAQTSDLATQLFQTGANEAQMSGQLYQYLMNYQVQQDQALSQGITNMVTALAGFSRPLTAAAA